MYSDIYSSSMCCCTFSRCVGLYLFGKHVPRTCAIPKYRQQLFI